MAAPDSDKGSITADDIRSAITDGMTGTSRLPMGTDVAGDTVVGATPDDGRVDSDLIGPVVAAYAGLAVAGSDVVAAGASRIATALGMDGAATGTVTTSTTEATTVGTEGAEAGEGISAETTDHGATRMVERDITDADTQNAIQSAQQSGQVTTQIGKYGTPQNVYTGTNGVTVVIETAGRNAGKIISTWRQ